MRDVRLVRLTLRNFKGIREFVLEPAAANITIWGENATGKTTLADAYRWLLTGKDSSGRSAFDIKPLGADGRPSHNLEHEVEAVLEVAGVPLALRKVHAEVWTKKRGSATAEFTGHAVTHYIDGVPVTEGEYKACVAQIADERTLALLSDPGAFNALHWQERRKVLLAVCGDVCDADVIAGDPALAELPALLGKRSLEDHRKVVNARRAEINKELDKVPVRIDEATRALPGEDDISLPVLEAGLARLRDQRQAKLAERARIEAGGEAAERRMRLRAAEAGLADAQRIARADTDRAAAEASARLRDLQIRADSVRREIAGWHGEIRDAELESGRLTPRLDALRAEWHAVDQRALLLDQTEVCPACGQALPEERLQAARETALAEHNLRKAGRLEEIAAEGRLLRARGDELQRAVEQRGLSAAQAAASLVALEAQVAEAQAEGARLVAAVPDLSGDADVQRLSAEIDALKASIESLQAGNAGALQQVAQQLRDLDSQIATAEAAVGRIGQRRQGLIRIEELRAQEKRLAAEFEELERQLYLCDQFTRAKVRLLTDRINSRFELARFKLFNVLVNGGLEECCETTYQGVPWGTALNRGACINVGLDIIRTLGEHYGLRLPVWLDNREAVTRLVPVPAQLISLVVSAADKQLRVVSDAAGVLAGQEAAR